MRRDLFYSINYTGLYIKNWSYLSKNSKIQEYSKNILCHFLKTYGIKTCFFQIHFTFFNSLGFPQPTNSPKKKNCRTNKTNKPTNLTTRNLYYCGGFFVAGAKTTAICRILQRFFGTATVHRVYFGICFGLSL